MIRSSIALGLLKLVQALLGIVSTVALTRLLGVEEFGVFAFGLAVATILAIPTKNGVTELIVREVAQAEIAGDRRRVAEVLLWASWFGLGYSALVALLVGASILLFAPQWVFAEATVVALLLIPVLTLQGNWSGGLRAVRRPVSGLIGEAAIKPLLHIVLMVTVFITPLALNAGRTLLLLVLATACAALWTRVSLSHALPREPEVPFGPYWKHATLWRAVIPFAAIGGLQVANRQADLIMLGLMTDEEHVGLYRAALQGSMLLTFGAQAVNVVAAPYFAVNRASPDRLWTPMRRSIFASLAVALPGLAIFVAFGGPLLALLFGPEFEAARVVLVVLSVSNTAAMMNGAVLPLLNMTGHEGAILRSIAVALIINILLNFLLIPFAGPTGAASAALISSLGLTWSLRRAAVHRLQIDPFAAMINRKAPHV